MTATYFQQVTQALNDEGIGHPTLVIDKQRLDKNIQFLNRQLDGNKAFRLVAKSLPSVGLIQYILNKTKTNRLMSFHIPFAIHLIESIPDADILMGKPMPINAVQYFYNWHKQSQSSFNPVNQMQWLVDSVERLQDYQAFAHSTDQALKINLEINIGLNRGGFECSDDFLKALNIIHSDPLLKMGGLMGYEAHISKIPKFMGGIGKALNISNKRYEAFVSLTENVFGSEALQTMCLNTGGSSTYPLYRNNQIVNEIATASALVKPTDFDVITLEHHMPATFIAAPILKDIKKPQLPMASGLSKLLQSIGLMPKRGLFIYGGNWLAKPCYPTPAKRSNILGASSNQEMYEVDKSFPIKREDFMFFRPTQSESIFLQFGNIAVYDQGNISQYYSVFQYPDTISV